MLRHRGRARFGLCPAASSRQPGVVMRHLWLLGAILGVSVSLSTGLTAIRAQDGPATIRLVSGESPGEIVVMVEGARELYAFDIELTFTPGDAAVLDAEADQPGTQVTLGTFLEPGFVAVHNVDNGAGLVRVALTQVAPAEPVSGDGAILMVAFGGDAPADFAIGGVLLARGDGSEHPAVIAAPGGGSPVPAPTPGALLNTPTPAAQPPSATATAPTRTPESAATPTATPSVASGATVEDGVAPSSVDSDDGGLPAWVWLALGGALVAAVAVATFLRRSRDER